MLKIIKKGVVLLLCTCIVGSSNLKVSAENMDSRNLERIAESEEIRVQKINDLYNQKQKLYSEYFASNESYIISEINAIELQLIDLGVSSYSQQEMENKLEILGDQISPAVSIPPTVSNIKWSTYRYKIVIWGKLHEMQIVMAEPTLHNAPPLHNTDVNIKKLVDYGDGVRAAAIGVLDIVAGELAGKIPGGNISKTLYDLSNDTNGALSANEVIKSAEYIIISKSISTFKYGFLKVDGKADWEQVYVYVGNSVTLHHQITVTTSVMVNGSVVPKFVNVIVAATHKSPSYDFITLKVIPSPVYDYCYVVYSLDEPLYKIPIKYLNTTYYHSVPKPQYTEHGQSKSEFYEFHY
jgi:hypothetical protein